MDAADTETAAPQDAKPWLDAIEEAGKVFQDWQDRCGKIEKLYADAKNIGGGADREFQIFWANLEVMKPTVYSRPPQPVVSPRFRDRKPLPRRAADVLERALQADVDTDHLHQTLLHARDDMVVCARGVIWVRDFDGEAAPTAEHVDRDDFRHEPARKWSEVGWVARRAWLTRDQVEKRFGEEKAYKVKFEEQTHGTPDDTKLKGKKAEVWEVWSRDENLVLWVSPGCTEVLDEMEPWLQLEGFFPCPRPAYGTLQPRTLIPVPDFVYYKDQVEEINDLTRRISALTEALKLRGFYPKGNEDVATAIEKAFRDNSDNATLIGVSSMGALGGVSLKDSIVWMPVVEVATIVRELVALRRELIDDVYQITGLSDIMRGATQASETLGAQQLKSQYGQIRVQSRQEEMARIARDVLRLKAEIMAETVDPQVLLDMSQVDDLPTQAELQQQAMQMQMAMQQQPEQAEAMQAQMQTMQNTVTLEAVVGLYRDQRLRPFVLDIETDSTIRPDEDADKQRRSEFLTAVGGVLQQGVGAMQIAPQLGPFIAEALRFAASGFRAGRQMDTAIDELAEQLANFQPPQQQGDNNEAAAQVEGQKLQLEAEAKQAEMQMKQAEMQAKQQEMQAKLQIEAQRMQMDAQSQQVDAQMRGRETDAKIELIAAQIAKIEAEIGRTEKQAAIIGKEPKNGDA